MFRDLDRDLALAINFKHITQPIYGDYSVTGRILGPIFRLGRIFFGGVVYLFLGLIVSVVFMIYLSLPVGIIYESIHAFARK